MPDTGLYPNYEGESFKEPYGLGIGPVMKLGYKTVFWYGGFSTWQNVKTLFYLKVSMNSTMPLKCQAKTAMLGA